MFRLLSLKLLTVTILLPITTWGWGGRGHHSICEAASFLVQEEGLKQVIAHKAHIMGFLCNIPDTFWKNSGAEQNKIGSPTHYVDPEIIGMKPLEIPLDYQKIVDEFTGKPMQVKKGTLHSVPTEFGSNWWRADQFFRRASALKEDFSKASSPTNSKEEQDDSSLFNKSADQFFVNIGLMGHFVGDNGQPFHSSVDYDGYLSGHGGIHAYYEDAIVSAIDYDLISKIVRKARELQSLAKTKKASAKVSFLNEKTVLEKMRALSALSQADIQEVYKLDKVKAPSTLKEEKGMQMKKPAERLPAKETVAKFEALAILHMARSASLLAQLWDQAYVNAGKPPLTVYKSYKFPFQPEFIAPDYYVEKK